MREEGRQKGHLKDMASPADNLLIGKQDLKGKLANRFKLADRWASAYTKAANSLAKLAQEEPVPPVYTPAPELVKLIQDYFISEMNAGTLGAAADPFKLANEIAGDPQKSIDWLNQRYAATGNPQFFNAAKGVMIATAPETVKQLTDNKADYSDYYSQSPVWMETRQAINAANQNSFVPVDPATVPQASTGAKIFNNVVGPALNTAGLALAGTASSSGLGQTTKLKEILKRVPTRAGAVPVLQNVGTDTATTSGMVGGVSAVGGDPDIPYTAASLAYGVPSTAAATLSGAPNFLGKLRAAAAAGLITSGARGAARLANSLTAEGREAQSDAIEKNIKEDMLANEAGLHTAPGHAANVASSLFGSVNYDQASAGLARSMLDSETKARLKEEALRDYYSSTGQLMPEDVRAHTNQAIKELNAAFYGLDPKSMHFMADAIARARLAGQSNPDTVEADDAAIAAVNSHFADLAKQIPAAFNIPNNPKIPRYARELSKLELARRNVERTIRLVGAANVEPEQLIQAGLSRANQLDKIHPADDKTWISRHSISSVGTDDETLAKARQDLLLAKQENEKRFRHSPEGIAASADIKVQGAKTQLALQEAEAHKKQQAAAAKARADVAAQAKANDEAYWTRREQETAPGAALANVRAARTTTSADAHKANMDSMNKQFAASTEANANLRQSTTAAIDGLLNKFQNTPRPVMPGPVQSSTVADVNKPVVGYPNPGKI